MIHYNTPYHIAAYNTVGTYCGTPQTVPRILVQTKLIHFSHLNHCAPDKYVARATHFLLPVTNSLSHYIVPIFNQQQFYSAADLADYNCYLQVNTLT
jgi:hypothetical protein